LPRAGELKKTEKFLQAAGGCAMNVAADLRRLGRSAALAGMVGEDMFGDFVIREAERCGIIASGVQRSSQSQTSNTVIIPVRGEDRRYLHSTGANSDFSLAGFDRSLLEGAGVLYVGGYLAMPKFNPVDLADLFHYARQRQLITLLDVIVPVGATVSLSEVEDVLPHTDYFLPNDDEARRLTGCEDVRGQAETLSRLNPECCVVITRGVRGCTAKWRSEWIETPAYPVESVDESGAGDAFTAGLIAGILEGWPLDRILRFASVVGASCTRALGCTDGVFTFEQAAEVLDRQCQ
jgi:sugar/nucleoside kinase (ribokinase family)